MPEPGQAAVSQPAAPQAAPQSSLDMAMSIVDNWIKPANEPQSQSPVEPAPSPASSAPEPEKAPAPEEGTKEVEAEAPAREPETEAAKEEARRYKLKYRGEDIEVDEKELQSGYLMHRDYTQKTQELAKEREELPAQLKAQVEPVIKQYQERLQLFEKAVWQALAPEVNNTDWNTLARDNPAEWAQRMQAVTNVNNILSGIKQEQERLTQASQESMRQNVQKQAKASVEVLQRDIPDWSQETYNAIRKNGEKYGFSAEELSQIADPRAIKVLYDAMKFRALQEARPEVAKKVEAVPKVMKPGSVPPKTDPKAEKWKDAMTRFQKSGGKDKVGLDVARLFVE